MATQGSSVWNFGDCFLTQMYFFTAFCSLQMGVFISSGAGKVRLHLCSTGGLPLPRGVEREIEARCKNDDFYPRVSPQSCKEISDMASMQAMYLRELTREAGVPLQRQCVGVQCKNERVQMLVEDCLYRLGAKSGDEVTLRFGADGTTVSAFHRTCGWITHDKLLTLCCKADLEAGARCRAANRGAVYHHPYCACLRADVRCGTAVRPSASMTATPGAWRKAACIRATHFF